MFLVLLFPLLASSLELKFNTFENIIINELPTDGAKGLLVSGNPKLLNNNLPVFNVIDESLFRYLGMIQGTISLIELKDNRTNFDTWIFNETVVETNGNIAFDISTLLETTQSPQVFEQKNQMNEELNLYMDNEVYKKHVNVVLFFRDEVEAMQLANMIHQQNFSNVTYNCWDVLRSDPPVFIDTVPSIGITSEVYRKQIPILRSPLNNETLKTFIKANLKEIAIKEARNKA